MNIVPGEVKQNFEYFIDWLSDWACTRRAGLGTRLPWDKKWIIEPLSDSTIYMAFFIISRYLNAGLIEEAQLTHEFFDFVFLGRCKVKDVTENTKITEEMLMKIRDEFSYWYPLNLNLGGKEHKAVHFPFFIFHHLSQCFIK